jgi:hypothetical protein
MSTTIITSRRSRTTESATQLTSRREPSTSTTQRRPITTTSASLRLASTSTTASPTNLEPDFSFVQLETSSSLPSASSTETANALPNTGAVVSPADSCSTNNDCAKDRTCSNKRCISVNDAAPLGGSGSEWTSQMSTGAAIGISFGVLAFIGLLIGVGFWYWRFRGRRPLKASIEAPAFNRNRSASSATDQKTLVASLPNSPHDVRFGQQHSMNIPPAFFAKALDSHPVREKPLPAPSGSGDYETSRDSTGKALPVPPSTESPLPLPPTEPTQKETTRYAVNVNINKSMIFDDEMINAVSSLRGNDTPRSSGTPRDRTQYRFEEYVPPKTKPPPISITRAPSSPKRNSEYELGQYPNKRPSADTVSARSDDSEKTDSSPPSPILDTLSKLESKAPVLPFDLPPPSPSFSFRSYDWYQDIIGDGQQNAEPTTPTVPTRHPARTPTQANFPKSLTLSPKKKPAGIDASLIPEPLSPAAPPAAPGLHLHPSSASALPSPTSINFRLSPTVYTMPSRQDSNSPPIPPTAPLKNSARASRASMMSATTQTTHNSRSWLPDEGLYLAEEGEEDYTTWKSFQRRSEDSRPTSYSPLT